MLANNIRKNPFVLAPTMTAFLLVLTGIVGFLPLDSLGQTASQILFAVIVLMAFGVPTVLFFFLRGAVAERFGWRPLTSCGWRTMLSASALLILQNLLFQAIFFADTYDYRVYTVYGGVFSAEAKSFWSFLLMLLVFVFIPALAEGVFFRGILLYEYRYAGPFLSIVLSAFFYGLTSMSFSSFPIVFFNGVLLAAVAFLTGNGVASVISHVVYLLFSVFLEKYFVFIAREAETELLFFFVFGLLFLFSLLCFFRCAEATLRERASAEDEIPLRLPKQKRGLVFYDVFSAPMLWGDLFCFILFAVLHLFL